MKKIFNVLERIRRIFFLLSDIYFEKINRLDLSGIILRENLNPINSETKVHATAYQAVWNKNLDELFSKALQLEIKFEYFVDIGSGKGKACFYANKRKISPKIIGIEFDGNLVRIANNNKKNISSLNVNFYHEDASNYNLPDANCIIFMFNPFDDILLERFLIKNRCHFDKNDSIILYANDIHQEVLLKYNFSVFYRNSTRKISIYNYIKN